LWQKTSDSAALIECVTAENSRLFAGFLDQMYRRRYDIFVKTRGWKGLDRGDGTEKDRFDNDDAVYLLSIRENGMLDGAMRLIPTTCPHLLSEVFPDFVAGAVPRGPDIYEMTRYFTIRDRDNAARMRIVAGELLCAMFEYCLDMRAKWITTMFDTFYLRRTRENHWNEILLGPAAKYDEGTAVAAKFAVSERNLDATRKTHGISYRALSYTGFPAQRISTAA
jgi:acyl-homoserine lactone synthase